MQGRVDAEPICKLYKDYTYVTDENFFVSIWSNEGAIYPVTMITK